MRLGTYYRARLLDYLHITAHRNYALDVGGYDGYWLSTQKTKHKYALDIDVNKKYKGVHYVQHTALDIPFKNNIFDQEFAFDVLEHIEKNKEKMFLKELIRVCKKGGEIIISTPSKNIKMFPRIFTNPISRMWGHEKCNGYSKSELKEIFSSFNNIDYQILDNNAPSFRLLFIGVRFLWIVWSTVAKWIVNNIASYDSGHTIGDFGFYIIKIIKK